ncbi:MAG: hypothetical protein KY450_11265 [Actinobacteria bacterium]|nr:hypothetical protein [Actinomycetota bacterium]
MTGQLTVFGPGDAFTVEADGRQDTRTGTFEPVVPRWAADRRAGRLYGPFVMSTESELREAFDDFESGRIGIVPTNHPLVPTDDVAAETDSSLD